MISAHALPGRWCEGAALSAARSLRSAVRRIPSKPDCCRWCRNGHPPLRERVAALNSLPKGNDGDTRPAVSLLGDPQRWERRLLASAINEDWARSLTPVAWEKVVETVYVPMWRQAVKENTKNLAGTLLSRPSFAGKLAAAMARGQLMDAEQTVMDRVTSHHHRAVARAPYAGMAGAHGARRGHRLSSPGAGDPAGRGVDGRGHREGEFRCVGGAVRGAGA